MSQAALDTLLHALSGPLTLVDVGARWGVLGRWAALGEKARIVGFDPDAEECGRLNAVAPPNVRYVAAGLADTEGTRTLHVAKQPACSSIFPPVRALVEQYPALAEVEITHTVEMPCRPLDDLLRAEGIGPVAAIKLDTQGSELAILKGGVGALAGCALIDVEVEFNPIYSGQALFCDVDRFLRDHGFVLWRLENLAHYSTQTVPAAFSQMIFHADPSPAASAQVANGQVFWAQAQYVRASYPRTGADSLTRAEAIPAAVLAGLYGFWDLALELVRKTGDADLLETLQGQLAPAA
ncbi:FkbM family methyltransferase [Azorhizobium doebereinerae]|uniref:FkbM family methyltransferase n=1 Tax=Azorhizobium doebereinerae TaxID=281091 RepID=UPI0003FCD8E2|nr:FkbM family methyltransferase [Azorhizobium doebereinerae]